MAASSGGALQSVISLVSTMEWWWVLTIKATIDSVLRIVVGHFFPKLYYLHKSGWELQAILQSDTAHMSHTSFCQPGGLGTDGGHPRDGRSDQTSRPQSYTRHPYPIFLDGNHTGKQAGNVWWFAATASQTDSSGSFSTGHQYTWCEPAEPSQARPRAQSHR